MKLPEIQAAEFELIRQQVRCLTLINGYLSLGVIALGAWVIYKIVGIFL